MTCDTLRLSATRPLKQLEHPWRDCWVSLDLPTLRLRCSRIAKKVQHQTLIYTRLRTPTCDEGCPSANDSLTTGFQFFNARPANIASPVPLLCKATLTSSAKQAKNLPIHTEWIPTCNRGQNRTLQHHWGFVATPPGESPSDRNW